MGWSDANWLPPHVRNHNIEMMKRPPAPPRVLGPWHSASVHENNCRCERCKTLNVNGYTPKEK